MEANAARPPTFADVDSYPGLPCTHLQDHKFTKLPYAGKKKEMALTLPHMYVITQSEPSEKLHSKTKLSSHPYNLSTHSMKASTAARPANAPPKLGEVIPAAPV